MARRLYIMNQSCCWPSDCSLLISIWIIFMCIMHLRNPKYYKLNIYYFLELDCMLQYIFNILQKCKDKRRSVKWYTEIGRVNDILTALLGSLSSRNSSEMWGFLGRFASLLAPNTYCEQWYLMCECRESRAEVLTWLITDIMKFIQ